MCGAHKMVSVIISQLRGANLSKNELSFTTIRCAEKNRKTVMSLIEDADMIKRSDQA